MAKDKMERDTLKVIEGQDEKPMRDRDQAPNSPARAQEKADQAEFGHTAGTQDKANADESLIGRDNMKGTPR